MRLFFSHFAVVEPLFNCAVLIPSVVPGQSLLGRGQWVLEDFILALKDGAGLDGGLVWVLVFGVLASEFGFIFDVLVGFIDIYMSCR